MLEQNFKRGRSLLKFQYKIQTKTRFLMVYCTSLRSASQQAGMGERILRVRCAGYRVVPVLVVAGLRHAPVPPHHLPPGEGVHPQVIR